MISVGRNNTSLIFKVKDILFISALLTILLIGSNVCYAQDSKSKEAGILFVKIEEGLNTGAVDKFSKYFSSKNYISLANGTSGYYSANQSYYVIKDFLSVYQPISFKLTNSVLETSNPFASGMFKFNNKGIRGNATVFIALQYLDNQWRISQITIN